MHFILASSTPLHLLEAKVLRFRISRSVDTQFVVSLDWYYKGGISEAYILNRLDLLFLRRNMPSGTFP